MMDRELIFILVGAFFIATGLLQIIKVKSYQKYALDKGVVDTNKTVKLSALILLGLGAAVMIPPAQEYAIYGLCGFLIVSAISIHKFWESKTVEDRVSEALHFGKNVGMAILLYGLSL